MECIKNAYYNIFSEKIFFFSDIEGSNVYDKVNKNKIEDLKHIEIKDGMITNIDNRSSLVFLGDLIDHNIYDIRLMKSMNKMKKNKPKNIILITGNRDLNKILLLNEFIINNNKENIIYEYLNICKNNNDIISCYENFIDYCKHISKNFNIKYHFLTNNIVDMLKNYLNIIPQNNLHQIIRIKYIYKYILGAPLILKNRKKEIEIILNISNEFKKKFELTKNENCAYVLLINMILFGNYQTNNLFVNKFKNIEMEYLLNTHLLAIIKHNEKKYLLSHSYIPNDGILSVPFASNYRKNYIQQHDLKKFLFWLNKNFIKKLSFLSNCYVKNISNINFHKFNKYINNLMSTCCHKYLHHTKTNVNNANIVTRQYKLSNLYGGSNITSDAHDKNYHNIVDNKKNKKFYYNFFDNFINKKPIEYLLIGHTPFSSIPVIETNNNLTTKIIHLDVSKGDGVPISKKTFCFFVVTMENNYFIGRIHLINSSKNKKLNIEYYANNNDKKLNNLIINNKLKKHIYNYYKHDIKFLLKNHLFQINNNCINFIICINNIYYLVKTIIGNYQNKYLNKYYFCSLKQ